MLSSPRGTLLSPSRSMRGLLTGAQAPISTVKQGHLPVVASALGTTAGAVSGSYTATRSGIYLVLLYGAGGNGGVSPGSVATMGGGGGAAAKLMRLRLGETITFEAGGSGLGSFAWESAGNLAFQATAGGAGGSGYAAVEPGIGIGGDINRTGGVFAYYNTDANTNTSEGVRLQFPDPNGGAWPLNGTGIVPLTTPNVSCTIPGAGFREFLPGVGGDGMFAGSDGVGVGVGASGRLSASAPPFFGGPGAVVVLGPVRD